MATYLIVTSYFDENKNVIKQTRSKHVAAASMMCFNNMQFNTYGADSAEVFDFETCVVHCQFKLDKKTHRIITDYNRDPTKFYNTVRRSFSGLLGPILDVKIKKHAA